MRGDLEMTFLPLANPYELYEGVKAYCSVDAAGADGEVLLQDCVGCYHC